MNKAKALTGLGIIGGGGTAAAVGVSSLYISGESKNEEAILDQEEQKEEKVQTKPVAVEVNPSWISDAESAISTGKAADAILQWGETSGGCAIRAKFQEGGKAEKMMELSNNTNASKETDLKNLYAVLLNKNAEVETLCETSNSSGKVLQATKLQTNKWIFQEGDEVEDSDRPPVADFEEDEQQKR